MVKVKLTPFIEIMNNKNFKALCEANAADPSIVNTDLTKGEPLLDRFLERESNDMFFMVGAFDQDRLIGFIGCSSYEYILTGQKIGTIDPFFVLRDYRKFGVGARLIEKTKELAKEKNIVGLFFGAPAGSAVAKAYSKRFEKTNEVFWCKI